MASIKKNGSSNKEIIKSLVHIETDDPYVKISLNASAGSLGFEVKQKTIDLAIAETDLIIKEYGHMINLKTNMPDKATGKIESFV